ncbi:MAG: GNAT family N-acetyltransferase [Clostridia bacterium]|nr:GNAT family N-acetyltransferase [Clostridia bacterium]
MDIRFVLPSEVEQLARNVVTSFPSKTPEALLRNMEGELYRPDEGRYLGCFDDDGTLLGSILMMDFTLNVRGVMMPMGAAAYVSANFLHKKEHVAVSLLKVLMRYYAKLGTPMGCLHPFSPAFYGKMGYGYCNENILYQPKPCYIRSFGDKSGLSYARAEDRDEIVEYYRAYARRTPGATVHHFMDPHRIFDLPYVVVCRREGKLTGYFTFEFVNVDHYTDMYHDLRVNEMIYDDLDTLKQFMTFFASQVDQIERVRIMSTDEYLHMMFLNPDTGENRAQDGCIHEIGRRTMGYMARIFDIRDYFKVQTHCETPARNDFVLALQVSDNMVDTNSGTFYLHIAGGKVELVEHAHANVTLTTGIAELSSLVMGAYPLEKALTMGRMTLSDHAYAEDIQRALGWSVKPVNITYF